MDDIEYAGRASTLKLSSVEEDTKSAQAKYRQDMMANAFRRTVPKKPQMEELIRERFPEEN